MSIPGLGTSPPGPLSVQRRGGVATHISKSVGNIGVFGSAVVRLVRQAHQRGGEVKVEVKVDRVLLGGRAVTVMKIELAT